jgi:hypothetical protein
LNVHYGGVRPLKATLTNPEAQVGCGRLMLIKAMMKVAIVIQEEHSNCDRFGQYWAIRWCSLIGAGPSSAQKITIERRNNEHCRRGQSHGLPRGLTRSPTTSGSTTLAA